MARIRTVKPELFKHEGLFELEQQTGLPIRIAFIGLFTCCDREGRFKWRPRSLKLDACPYDECDFSRVLDALMSRGFVVKYVVDGEEYGFIPTFLKHQVINNRESASDLPEPDESSVETATSTRDLRVIDASPTRHEGKGMEGKGRGKEEEGKEGCAVATLPVAAGKAQGGEKVETALQAACRATWGAYSEAYVRRYGTEPVRDAKANSCIKSFVQSIGFEEAPLVAQFYVAHNKAFYVRRCHEPSLLKSDAAGLRTEWATGRRITETQAREADRLQDTGDMWGRIMQQHEQNGGNHG